jgi:hypothetical protein
MGLRKEIKHLVDVLNPKKLNDVFNYAYKFELSFESQKKRYKVVSKPQQALKYLMERKRFIKDKKENTNVSTEIVLIF